MAQAMAETIGYVNRSRAFMPPGTVSPFIMRFDTGSVPVGYLVLSSETRVDRRDPGPGAVSRSGRCSPTPAGRLGAAAVRRQPAHGRRHASTRDRLRSYGMSPDEVVTALTRGQHDQPVGQHPHRRQDADRAGQLAWSATSSELGNIPIRTGASPRLPPRRRPPIAGRSRHPTGYALVNGRRAVYILVTKRADASTLTRRQQRQEGAARRCRRPCRDDIKVSFEFDQSPYVTRADAERGDRRGCSGAVLDRADGAAVPARLAERHRRRAQHPARALLGSVVALWLTGQTINLMTLGGLALAVGILVDEATVEIENIHAQMQRGLSPARAVSMAPPRRPCRGCWRCSASWRCSSRRSSCRGRPLLFVPLSLAVGFAMVASYLLSSTFVPVLSVWLLKEHQRRSEAAATTPFRPTPRPLSRVC